MAAHQDIALVIVLCFTCVLGRPYNDGNQQAINNIQRQQQQQQRDPRSFKSFVGSTSKSVVDLAEKAMKSFFPYVGNNKNLLDDQVNGLHMNRRRSNIAGLPSSQYNYLPYQQIVAPPAVNYAQYYGGYPQPQQQYMNYQRAASPFVEGYAQQPVSAGQMQQDMSKRYNIQGQLSTNNPPATISDTGKDSMTLTQKASAAKQSDNNEDGIAQASILDVINNDADGFFDAITNTKEAMVTKGKDGEMNLLETVEGNSNKAGIAATKKSKINKPGKKNIKKQKKMFEESYKRALKSQGDLEKKLVAYFTDYICGTDC